MGGKAPRRRKSEQALRRREAPLPQARRRLAQTKPGASGAHRLLPQQRPLQVLQGVPSVCLQGSCRANTQTRTFTGLTEQVPEVPRLAGLLSTWFSLESPSTRSGFHELHQRDSSMAWLSPEQQGPGRTAGGLPVSESTVRTPVPAAASVCRDANPRSRGSSRLPLLKAERRPPRPPRASGWTSGWLPVLGKADRVER